MRRQLVKLLDENTDQKTVTKVLGGAFVVALLLVVGFALTPIGTGNQHTEFYVLGPDGTASEYPENLTVEQTAELRVGIGNYEGQSRTYTLVVQTNETTFVNRSVTVNSGESWEESVTVAFDSPGTKQLRLELHEDQGTDGEPYRDLRLYIEVDSS